jgi:hypothetical protein
VAAASTTIIAAKAQKHGPALFLLGRRQDRARATDQRGYAAQQNNRGLEKWFPTRSKRGRGPVEGIRASDKHRNSALVPLGKCS